MKTDTPRRAVGRRDFLSAVTIGLPAVGLAGLSRAAGGHEADVSCIFVWLQGGPSHLETYDLKPDAPAEYRGEFKPIKTNVPGLELCELLPRHARMADKFSLVRSVTHNFSAHAGGTQQVLSGRAPRFVERDEPDYPDVGSIYKKVRTASGRPRPLPPYVTMPHRFQSGGPAYLGRACDPFTLSHSLRGPVVPPPNLSLSVSQARLDDRRKMLASFDGMRRDLDRSGALSALDESQREAAELLAGGRARRAFDLGRVPSRLRDRYGRTQVGQSLLLARQLVEEGVGFVAVQAGAFDSPSGNGNWDDHAVAWNVFEQMKLRLPVYDQALCALIEDVYARGLDRRVLIVALGEFGRTPRINVVRGRPGREHHPGAMSILVSGGGLRMGQVVGSTDARGERPRTRALRPGDFLATLYRCLGVDADESFPDHSGRPMPILPAGEPIAELIG